MLLNPASLGSHHSTPKPESFDEHCRFIMHPFLLSSSLMLPLTLVTSAGISPRSCASSWVLESRQINILRWYINIRFWWFVRQFVAVLSFLNMILYKINYLQGSSLCCPLHYSARDQRTSIINAWALLMMSRALVDVKNYLQMPDEQVHWCSRLSKVS